MRGKHGLWGGGSRRQGEPGTRRREEFRLSSPSEGKRRTARNEAGGLGRVQTTEVPMPNTASDMLTLK